MSSHCQLLQNNHNFYSTINNNCHKHTYDFVAFWTSRNCLSPVYLDLNSDPIHLFTHFLFPWDETLFLLELRWDSLFFSSWISSIAPFPFSDTGTQAIFFANWRRWRRRTKIPTNAIRPKSAHKIPCNLQFKVSYEFAWFFSVHNPKFCVFPSILFRVFFFFYFCHKFALPSLFRLRFFFESFDHLP